MKLPLPFIVSSLFVIAGCHETAPDRDRQTTLAGRDAEVVNSFGMTFALISIDPTVSVQSDPPFPTETYYIQKAEISAEHLSSFRAYLKSRNVELQGHDDLITTFPSEWRHYSELAELMSKYDPEYDYRLPTRSEWVFACMSGYEQRCMKQLNPGSKPNACGLVDMLDGDVECISEVGVLMGLWKENWPGIYDGHEKPACACKWWTICNPDADDDLNEIIVARFVLVRKNGTPPETP